MAPHRVELTLGVGAVDPDVELDEPNAVRQRGGRSGEWPESRRGPGRRVRVPGGSASRGTRTDEREGDERRHDAGEDAGRAGRLGRAGGRRRGIGNGRREGSPEGALELLEDPSRRPLRDAFPVGAVELEVRDRVDSVLLATGLPQFWMSTFRTTRRSEFSPREIVDRRGELPARARTSRRRKSKRTSFPGKRCRLEVDAATVRDRLDRGRPRETGRRDDGEEEGRDEPSRETRLGHGAGRRVEPHTEEMMPRVDRQVERQESPPELPPFPLLFETAYGSVRARPRRGPCRG